MHAVELKPAPAATPMRSDLSALLIALSLLGLSITAFSQALAVDTHNDGQTVYFVGDNNNLYEMPFPYATGDWSQLTGVNGVPAMAAKSGLAAIYNSIYGAPEEYYLTSTTGGLHVEQLYGTGYSATDLTQKYDGAPAASGSSVVGFIDSCAQTDNVFYVGANQDLELLTWSANRPWSQVDLTQTFSHVQVAGTVLTAHEASQSEEVFFVGINKHVYEMWRWSGCAGGSGYDGWHTTDLTLANDNGSPNALVGAALTGFYDNDSLAQLDAVFYVDSSLNVHELYMSGTITPTGEWQHESVTGQTGLKVASGGSLASQVFSTGAAGAIEHLYLADADANIWDIQSTPWQGTAVTWYGAQGVSASTPSNKYGPVAGSPLAVSYNSLCNADAFAAGLCEPGAANEQVFWIITDPIVLEVSVPTTNPVYGRYFSQLTYETGAPGPSP